MAKWQCDQYDHNARRRCRRNATTVTPRGDACDKCALAVVTSMLSMSHLSGNVTVWAIRELIRQEIKSA